MLNIDRFLPGFNHVLCGNPPKSALTQIKQKIDRLRESTLSELSDVFGNWVPSDRLERKAEKTNSRERVYSLRVTFWGFLSQVLSPDTPCREVVRKVQSYCSRNKLKVPSSATASYCDARGRMEHSDLQGIHQSIACKLQGRVMDKHRWKGHEVKVIDGTGITLPDTGDNQAEFPQPSVQREGCGFPVLKLVACFCLASGAILKWVETSLKSHESRILKQFLDIFGGNDVVLADRGFCSYSNLSLLAQKGVEAVMRLHQARSVDYRKGLRLGRYDRIARWKKPQRQKGWSKEDWEALPAYLDIRITRIFIAVKGFRARQYDLVTTLLDHREYTVEDLADLYFSRWAVELYFRDIKTTMGMEKLRCKTPEMVRKELVMFFVAYNLVRSLMQEAAIIYDRSPNRLSFKATVDTLRQFRSCFAATQGKPRVQGEIFDEMILVVASETVPLREHRSEPRAVKQRPKPFQRLTKHRSVFKVSKSRKSYYKSKKKNVDKAA